MAKPIKATPKLNSEESNLFIKQMLLVEKRKANKFEQFFIDSLRKS